MEINATDPEGANPHPQPGCPGVRVDTAAFRAFGPVEEKTPFK